MNHKLMDIELNDAVNEEKKDKSRFNLKTGKDSLGFVFANETQNTEALGMSLFNAMNKSSVLKTILNQQIIVEEKMPDETYSRLVRMLSSINPKIVSVSTSVKSSNNSFYKYDTFMSAMTTFILSVIPQPGLITLNWVTSIREFIDKLKFNFKSFNEVSSTDKVTEKHEATISTSNVLTKYTIMTTYKYTKHWFLGTWLTIDIESHVECRQVDSTNLNEKWKLFRSETSEGKSDV